MNSTCVSSRLAAGTVMVLAAGCAQHVSVPAQAQKGDPCVVDSECGPGLVCYSGTCFQICEASADCSGVNERCNDDNLCLFIGQGLCGDGFVVAPETCDDRNTAARDGCDATCTVEAGFGCSGEPSRCASTDVHAGPDAPMRFSYPQSPIQYTKGAAVVPVVPLVTGGAIESFGISPSLPLGLLFDGRSGIVSGIPFELSPQTVYTVTAQRGDAATDVALVITVVDEPPTALAFAHNPAVYTVGAAIAPNRPVVSGGNPVEFSVAPMLPPGLDMATDSGVVSGVPTAVAAEAPYRVTVRNSGGQTYADLQLRVDPAGAGLRYSTNPATYIRTVPIAPNTPTLSSGTATGYSVAPALPAGLVFDTVSGVISGTPTVVAALGNYVVSALPGGTDQVTLQLEVLAECPGLCGDVVPASWYGPFVVHAAPTAAACAAPYAIEAAQGRANLSFAPATCGCNCEPYCQVVVSQWQNSSTCFGFLSTWTPSQVEARRCLSRFAYESARVTDYSNSCNPLSTVGRPTVTWQEEMRACGGAFVQAGACGGGRSCYPTPAAPFAAALCVTRAGVFDCPVDQGYAVKRTSFTAFVDSRGCTNCSCSGTLSCSNERIEFRDGGCNGTTVTTINPTGACVAIDPAADAAVMLATVSSNTCAGTSVAATGSVVPDLATAVTICCTE